MSWQLFRQSNGGFFYQPSVAAQAGGAEKGLLVCAAAALTAAADGSPFIRYVSGRIPLWSDLVLIPEKRLESLLEWLFDCNPDGSGPLDRIRRAARREGPIHYFCDEAVLSSLMEMLKSSGESCSSGVVPGRVWWSGPVSAWKDSVIEWLKSTGRDAGIDRARLSAALECLLDELYRDHSRGLRTFDADGSFLDTYVRHRYSPDGGNPLPFLQYDVLWADIRSLTGFMGLRPPAGDPGNRSIRSSLISLVSELHALRLDHRDYFRAVRSSCLSARKAVGLDSILRIDRSVLNSMQ